MYQNVKIFRPYVFAILLSSLILTGCKDIDCCMPGAITAYPPTITIMGTDNEEVIAIICNMSWNMITELPPWLEADPTPTSGSGNGTINVKAISPPAPDQDHSCVLTFKAANGDQASVKIQYGAALVSEITLDPDEIVLSLNELALPTPWTATLSADIMPLNADNKALNWNSDNSAVATVSLDGVVTITAVAGGIAIITASATDGSGVFGTCVITVTDGTEDYPFHINDLLDLEKLRDEVNAGDDKEGQYFIMTDGIVLPPASWTPIGNTLGTPFSGHFDGNGKEVSGLYISNSSSHGGLFGVVKDGTIENLGVTVSGINKSIGHYVGGIAGDLNGGEVSRCYVIGDDPGTFIIGGSSIGGVVGYAYNDGKVVGCYASINVRGTQAIGGVVGRVDDGSSVEDCYATGNVEVSNQGGGGVVGRLIGSVTNCYATGTISGTSLGPNPMYLGGIAGRIFAGGSVTNCVALNPRVSTEHAANAYIGRVVGDNIGLPLGNNYAFIDMDLLENGVPKTPVDDTTGLDGGDCPDSPAASWWTTNMTTWLPSVWAFENTSRPTLIK